MGKINVYDKIVMKKRKYGNRRNLYMNLHLKKILEWNLQLSDTSWCQRERSRHLLHVPHIATLWAGHC